MATVRAAQVSAIHTNRDTGSGTDSAIDDVATAPLVAPAAVHPSVPVLPTGRAGDRIADRYVLENLVGVGGMGAVWAALDEHLDRPVALKELTAGQLPEAVAEARAAGKVHHPGVIVIRDVVSNGPLPWLVMDLIPGRSLARRIRQYGRLDPFTVRDIAHQLLAAVSAVHAAGLVHRDITPGNVLRTDSGRVVLADFGLAAGLGECAAPVSGRFLGSPPYVAPETVRDGSSGTAADLFAVGATLFAAVEGRRPFDAPTPQATMQALVTAPLPTMRHAGDLEPLLRGLLCKDPRQRVTTGQAQELLAG
jgi:eukaryotic-like serine/threonine-protein kinase